jgi:putative DNA primase/helicase
MISGSSTAKRIQWPTEQIREAAQRFGWGRLHSEMGVLSPEFQTGQHGPDPIHGGKDGWRVYPDGSQRGSYAETGGGHSNADGAFATGFSVIMRMKNCNFNEAVNDAGDFLHGLGVIGAPEKSTKGSKQHRDDSGKSRTSGQEKGPVKEANWEELAKAYHLIPASRSSDMSAEAAEKWTRAKRPIKPASLFASDVLIGKFYGNLVILGMPFFRNESEKIPLGAALYRCNGAEFEEHTNLKTGNVTARRKTHLLKPSGSGDGWFFAGGRERFAASSRVLVCAGPPDCLSSLGMLPPEWSAVTNAVGEQSELKFWLGRNAPPLNIFEGKTVFVVGDRDEVGQKSARNKAAAIATVASAVFLVFPPPLEGVKDLRDWMNAGNGWAEFEDVLAAAEEVPRPATEESRENPSDGALSGETTSAVVRTFDDEDLTDIGNARHFVRRNRNRLAYVPQWKKWIVWDSERWKPDDNQASLRLAKDTVSEIFALALDLKKPEREIAFAASSARLSRIQAMLTLASAEMPASPGDLDQNEWLFNCPNGTVDLRTGKMRPHAREDFITKLCPTDFNPDAECPVFMEFMEQVFRDNPEVISFWARLCGYFLTASVSEQILVICWGAGANGKSTFLNTILNVMGVEYAMQGQPDFLVEKHGEAHPTERADLFGKRLVICSETGSMKKLDEAKVKLLTGGERIRARRMREDFWEFNPTHKLILVTNHRPIIKGTDHGIWRRLLLIPFSQRFEGAAKDLQLPQKLQKESEGILAWAVRGCQQWMAEGLNPPGSVADATNDYRASEDIIGRFIKGTCLVDSSGSVFFKVLYARLEAWCEDTGDFCPSKRVVGGWLKENGFRDFQSGGRGYAGLTLLPDL